MASGNERLNFPQLFRNIYRIPWHIIFVAVFTSAVILSFLSLFEGRGDDKVSKKKNDSIYPVIVLMNEGEGDKAKKLLEDILQKDPENKWANRLYSKYLTFEITRIGEEIEKTKRVINASPDYKVAWLRLSLLYRKAGLTKLADEASKMAGTDSF